MEFKGFPEAAAPYHIHSTFSVKLKGENFGVFLLTAYMCGSTNKS
jgi:hypothetical protein